MVVQSVMVEFDGWKRLAVVVVPAGGGSTAAGDGAIGRKLQAPRTTGYWRANRQESGDVQGRNGERHESVQRAEQRMGFSRGSGEWEEQQAGGRARSCHTHTDSLTDSVADLTETSSKLMPKGRSVSAISASNAR